MAIDVTGSRIVLYVSNADGGVGYSDGTEQRSVDVDVVVYWANSTNIDMNIRVFCSHSSNVSNTNYESYEDYQRDDYKYFIVSSSSNGATFSGISFTGLDPKKNYYFKAYALTGTEYDIDDNLHPEEIELNVNTDLFSETEELYAIAPRVKCVNGPTFNVQQETNSIGVSALVKKAKMYGVGYQYKFVVFNSPARSSGNDYTDSFLTGQYLYSSPVKYLDYVKDIFSDRIAYEGNPTTMTSSSDSMTLNTTINNILPGTYICRVAVYYCDQYNTGEWILVDYEDRSAFYDGTDAQYIGAEGGPNKYRHVYSITGTTQIPTGSWGTLSVTQTPGAKTANYSAALTRTDSYQNQFYIRIRIIDLSDNQYVATGSGMQVANSGSTTFTGTTTKSYTAGTYSFQFVAEWRSSTSDSWSQLMTANGEQLKKTVSFVVTDSGSGSGQSEVSGMLPLWSWSKQNNAHATEQQVRQAYIAITSQGMPSYFPYQVWNSLLYFVRNCIEQFGKTWWGSEKGEKYLNFQYALMSDSDKVLTAKRFMTLTYNILNISASSGVSFSKPYYSVEREPGEIVYGAYFISATNAINDVLTQINILSQS